MRAFNRCLGLLAAGLMLASCGGGGGSGGDGAFQPTPSGTLTITATTTSLPMNRFGGIPFPGSPFIAEVDITWRRANGDLVSGQEVAVSINPVTVAAFSTLDDPSTPVVLDAQGNYDHGNEFRDTLGSGPVDVTGGHATVFVHSSATAGVATLTVTARDTASNTTISKTLQFTVNNVAASLPASISADVTPRSVYLQETGGSNSTVVTALVLDGGENYVPDPGTGNTAFNNVQMEVVGGANYGSLSALGAGGPNTGVSVKTRTIQGIATASFRAGTIQGPVQIRIIADRSDNNVDNGISDPLVATASAIVSDGKLFSLAITSPVENAIVQDNILGTALPNGNYSLVVSALATDRQGNPVPAGTAIRFGAIDFPATGFPAEGPGRFLIAGVDGDPQESGTLFTSQTGCFTGFIKPTDPRCSVTGPGERPGPGDTLLVFGDLVLGNRDLESARTITTINTATSLNVSVPFNRNDDSGNSLNSGPILPYVIGRAVDGNIRDSGSFNGGTLGITNSNGVATAILNYPNNRLGKRVYLYAQGDGVGAGGAIKKVTDIGQYVFAAARELELTASPESIGANSTAAVNVCVVDAFGAPVQGLSINFAFTALPAGGQGFVDNVPGSGQVEDRTGSNGCTIALVRTIGVNSSGGGGGGTDSPRVVFSFDTASDEVEITASGEGSLTAAPSFFRGSGGTITLTLRDSAGNPVPGVNINTQCTGDVSIQTPAGVTNAQGQTTAVINGDELNGFGEPGEGECTFTAASGEEAIVRFEGIDLCETNVSPPPPPELCGGTTTPIQLTVVANPTVAGATACGLTVSSNPSGITCSAPAGGGSVTCSAPFTQGQAVQLTAVGTGAGCPAATAPVSGTPPAPPYKTFTFSGGCTQSGPVSANVSLSAAQTCNVTVTVTP
ncbi:MAG TPA: Ig-like domain-containing protein [Tahibacter sp.]|uniref:Ig-like domain-containing protein n=1 Tax=Tahibacter sp. TaxID=2056211 RepID=UPI002D0C42D3|nr:Ig-like domain-containing protein [Tahibacter sp.]HSX60688.1 Ig-like domain-containing protein [Tahibacter sp.]